MESIGFRHLERAPRHACVLRAFLAAQEVTAPRVVMFRDAICDLLEMEPLKDSQYHLLPLLVVLVLVVVVVVVVVVLLLLLPHAWHLAFTRLLKEGSIGARHSF